MSTRNNFHNPTNFKSLNSPEKKKLRKTGVKIIGDVPWGTHFCQFYKTKEDLLDILVPYFKKGLEENEFCMWITAPPLSVEEAIKAMKKVLPDFESYIERGQIEIIPYSKWYIRSGKFEEKRVLKGWVRKLNKALKRGFAGLRLTGNTFWIEKKDWKAFSDYEETVNDVIGNYRMLAMCTYSLDKCGVNEILDVSNTHQFTLIKRKGEWRVIESCELRESRHALRAEIAERKRVEEEFRASENKYRLLIENLPQKVFYKDINSVYISCNDNYARDLKIGLGEIAGKTDYDFYPRELAERYRAVDKRVIESGKTEDLEEKYTQNGNDVFVQTVKTPVRDERGNIIGILGIFWDISERKRMEEKLRVNERRYATTLDSIGDAVIATDVRGRITFMNTVAEKLTGRTLDEASQKPLAEVFHIINEYTRGKVVNPVALALKNRNIVSLANHSVLVRKDKKEVPIEDSAAPIRDEDNNISGVVLVFRDITSRRRTEEKMLHLATFPDMTPNPVIELTVRGELIYSNPVAKRVFPDLEKMGVKHPYLDGLKSIFLQLKKNPGDVKREVNAGGKVYLQTIQYVRSQGVFRIYGSDISIRKRMEEVLRKSEAKFKALYDANIIGVVIGDLENNIFDANDAFLNIVGYTREELLQRKLNCNKLTIKKYKDRDKQAVKELLAHGVTTPWEKEYVRKDGSQVPVIIGKVLINKDTAETIAFVLDITERKKLESRKDEFIGTASHELKTPITIIKAFTQILQKRFEKSNDTQNEYFVKNIDDQVNRLTDLVSDLLDMSKIQAGKLKFNYKMFDMDSLIRKTIVDFQYITKIHEIERYGEIGMKLNGDEERIHQLLVNLLSNAVKYSPKASKIIVRTEIKNNCALVSVQDFGLGISESTKEKIFERFYTGPEKEKRNIPGFGMGLYLCREIIKGHKGKLWVESKRGEGSTFYFTLPIKLGDRG